MSPEARDLLSKMLAIEVSAQVQEGRGEEPMSPAWTELFSLVLDA